MEAEHVIEKILSDAKAEAEKIALSASEKRQAEEKQFNEQLQEFKKQSEALVKKAGRDRKERLLAAARMQTAKEELLEKRKMLDEVFAEARRRLLNLPDDEYRRIMSKLMLESVRSGDEEVIVDQNERRIDQGFIDEVNRRQQPAYKGQLKLSSQRANLGAGFILRRGRISINASIDVLLKCAKRELETKLASELFA